MEVETIDEGADRVAKFDERCFVASGLGAVADGPDAMVQLFVEYVSALFPNRSSAPSTPDDTVRTLSAMTELERHHLYDGFSETRGTPPLTLWTLGFGLVSVGRYRLSTGVYYHASAQASDPLVRAALAAKAGGTITTGGLGRMGEPLLAGALDTLKTLDATRRAAAQLVAGYAYFHLARRQLFRDNLSEAERLLDKAEKEVRAASANQAAADGHSPPEILVFRARLLRGRAETRREPLNSDFFELLALAEQCMGFSIFYPPLPKHYLMYQKAVALKLLNELEEAEELAREALGILEDKERQRTTASSHGLLRNTRREGYLRALLGDILTARRSFSEAAASYSTARQLWSHPYYPRGVSRVTRDHARCLMALGRHWTEVSELLSQSITNARGIGCRGSEARALAVRIDMHRRLGHGSRVVALKEEMTRLRRNSPDISALLSTLEGNERLSDIPEGLSDCLRDALDTTPADVCEGVLVVDGEPGVEISDLVGLFHVKRLEAGYTGQLVSKHRNTISTQLLLTSAVPPGTTIAVSAPAEALRGPFLRSVLSWGKGHLVVLCLEGDAAAVRAARARISSIRPPRAIVSVPPLRQRRPDIYAIGRRFLAHELSRPGVIAVRDVSLSTGAWNYLACYDWPGNTAQLRAAVARIARGVLAGEAKPQEHINDKGELLLEFVAPATAGIWARPPAPAETRVELSKSVPISLEEFTSMCEEQGLRTTEEVAIRLKPIYAYTSSIASLVRMINRNKTFQRALKETRPGKAPSRNSQEASDQHGES